MPCYHTLCLTCALTLQQSVNINQQNCVNLNCNSSPNSVGSICSVGLSSPVNAINGSTYVVSATVHQSQDETSHSINGNSINSINGDTGSSTGGSEISDQLDKVSLLSEADSGVICSSRPSSYVGTPNIQGILLPPFVQSVNATSLSCPVCHKLIYLDENGANNLPKNRTMQSIVDRFGDATNVSVKCQLCETEPKEAAVMCEQCDIYYCETCRDSCHPLRGPLASHKLIAAHLTKYLMRTKARDKDCVLKCAQHSDLALDKFCLHCRLALCQLCSQDNRHPGHEIQSLAVICKALKVSLALHVYYIICKTIKIAIQLNWL